MTDAEFYLYDLRTKFAKIDPSGYYLSYSGGKDSHLLLWFIREYAKIDGIEVVGLNTYMEHPQIMARMRSNCDTVLTPELKPNEIKERYGSPCFSKFQDEMIDRWQRGCRSEYLRERVYGTFADGSPVVGRFKLSKRSRELLLSGELHRVSCKCCEYLKKRPARSFERTSGKRPILGVRSSEGALRKARYTSCFNKQGFFTPIHDLTDALEEEIYAEFGIELPPIYAQVKRTGCMGCPYGTWKGDTQRELATLSGGRLAFVADLFAESYGVLGVEVPGER